MTRLASRAVAVLLLVLVVTACGSGDQDTTGTTRLQTTVTVAPTEPAPPSTRASTETLVARAEVDVISVYRDPDGDTVTHELDRREETTGNLVFVIEEEAGDDRPRHKVQLPVRPNGSTGWIEVSDVSVTRHQYEIEIELAAHQLRLLEAGQVLVEAPIAVGTQDTPTPGGSYYIKELLQPPDPSGPYGTYAYGLSGFSNVLQSFAGGDGVIGIHGTNQPALLGTDVSHGCIRLHNDVITDLVERIGLPLGVPVEIIG